MGRRVNVWCWLGGFFHGRGNLCLVLIGSLLRALDLAEDRHVEMLRRIVE